MIESFDMTEFDKKVKKAARRVTMLVMMVVGIDVWIIHQMLNASGDMKNIFLITAIITTASLVYALYFGLKDLAYVGANSTLNRG